MSDRPKPPTEIRDTFFSTISQDTAPDDIRRIGKGWMTLAMIHLVFALYFYLLPEMPLGMSGLTVEHVYYAPVLFVLGYLYSAYRTKLIPLAIALAFIVLILGEAYFYVVEHMEMIRADLSYPRLTLAAIWRLLLLFLALRSLRAALVYSPR